MKAFIGFLLLTVALTAAEAQPRKKTAPEKPAAKLQIPAGAIQSEDGSYHYTDPQGKKWIYRKTPFGIARLEDKPAAPAAGEQKDPWANVRATEAGDVIRFERPSPFGTYKWERRKSELNDMEQAVWNRERARTASRQE